MSMEEVYVKLQDLYLLEYDNDTNAYRRKNNHGGRREIYIPGERHSTINYRLVRLILPHGIECGMGGVDFNYFQ